MGQYERKFCCVVVVVVIIKLYLVQMGRFLAATSYVAPSSNHVHNNLPMSNSTSMFLKHKQKICMCVVVVEINNIYISTTGHFLAAIGYVVPTPNHVHLICIIGVYLNVAYHFMCVGGDFYQKALFRGVKSGALK